jgi:hypothetical protein
MDEVFLPIIRLKDYDAFWRLTNGDMPDTYEEWLDLHKQSKTERRQRGGVVIDVEVYPNEFAGFCTERHIDPDAKSLGDYALEEARRQRR